MGCGASQEAAVNRDAVTLGVPHFLNSVMPSHRASPPTDRRAVLSNDSGSLDDILACPEEGNAVSFERQGTMDTTEQLHAQCSAVSELSRVSTPAAPPVDYVGIALRHRSQRRSSSEVDVDENKPAFPCFDMQPADGTGPQENCSIEYMKQESCNTEYVKQESCTFVAMQLPTSRGASMVLTSDAFRDETSMLWSGSA